MCAYMTQKNIKGRTFFGAPASQGPTKTGYYPDIFATILENPHDPPFCSRGHVCTENALNYDLFQPSTRKSRLTSSTGQKRKPEEDPLESLGPKKRVFSSKWLEQFVLLVYVSTENHMKCKTCFDAYGSSAKPSQAFVHGATNFQRSALVRHQWGNDLAMAVEVIKQRKCHEKVMRHVEEKSSTALKAQVRTALLMAKEDIADCKFNALIDLQVSSPLLLKLNGFIWGITK